MFEIDHRSLAAFRIGIGVLTLSDLALRACDISAHYGGSSVLPLGSVPWHFATPFSVNLLGGSDLYQAGLFSLAALAALALIVGFHARVASLLLWYFVVSLHARNPLLLSGGDSLLHLVLMWSVFLPMGARWSVDGRARGVELGATTVAIASLGLMFQILAAIFFSGTAKLSSTAWTTDGNAVAYALHMRGTAVGAHLLELPPSTLRVLTRATLGLEIVGPVLLVAAWNAPWVRAAILLALATFLATLAVSLNVGILPLVALVGLSIFVPGRAWGGEVVECEAVRPPEAMAANGHARRGLRILASTACAWLLVASIASNTNLPIALAAPGRGLGLDYRWKMFAAPQNGTRWITVTGERSGWAPIELTGPGRGEVAPPVAERRRYGVSEYRWLRYEETLLQDGSPGRREDYGRYFCRIENAARERDAAYERVGLYVGYQRLVAGNEVAPARLDPIARVPCAARTQ